MTDKEKDCTDCKHYYTDYDCREFCEGRDMFEPKKTMTDKEAIEVLKDLWRYEHSEYSEKQIREALEKGIKALKNQADIISRIEAEKNKLNAEGDFVYSLSEIHIFDKCLEILKGEE